MKKYCEYLSEKKIGFLSICTLLKEKYKDEPVHMHCCITNGLYPKKACEYYIKTKKST